MKKNFTYIDLFAGIGGFRSAFTKLGGKCVYTNEWDKYSSQTYCAWYDEEEISNEDIREVNHKKIPSHDILCAGFPCQPFSLAGVSKKQSLGRAHGFDDKLQGNLFFSIMSIVDAKRPKVLFLENVKNLKSHDKGNTWKVIKNEIEKRNYILFDNVINAKYWVPQSRERVFMVAFDKKVFGKTINFSFPKQKKKVKVLKEILENNPDPKYTLSDKLWSYLFQYKIKQQKKGNGFGYGLFEGQDTARTMSARYYKDGAEILIKQKNKNPRRLSAKESMLIMGFDTSYSKLFKHKNGFPQVVSDTQAYKQFGNSVVPKVVESIGKKILEIL
jgi:DNA (cytosine-5)-methyltransferase 1